MAEMREDVLFGVWLASAFCIFSWKFSILSVNDTLLLAGRGLLLLAAAAWVCSCLLPKLKTYITSVMPERPAPLENPVDEHFREMARRELQQQQVDESIASNEVVLNPREEVHNHSQGSPLGADGDTEADAEENDETASQRAARSRKSLEKPLFNTTLKRRGRLTKSDGPSGS